MRVVGSLASVATGPEAAIEAIASPHTSLVTLTVTEKGYEPDAPAAAVIAAGLGPPAGGCAAARHRFARQRGRQRCAPPRAGARRSPERSTRRSAGGSRPTSAFPSSVVDRMVPATTPADLDRVAERLGVARSRRGRRRAPPLLGDRRDRRPAAAGRCRRRGRARRGAVRAPEAVAAERPALRVRLRRSGRRLHDDRGGGVARRRAGVRPAAGRRGAGGGRPPGVHAASDVRGGGAPAASPTPTWATRARRSATDGCAEAPAAVAARWSPAAGSSVSAPIGSPS